VDDVHVLIVSLLTLGDPHTLTGGYLYQQRVAALAPAFDARVNFVSLPLAPFPLPGVAAPVVLRRAARQRPHALLIDSIAAAYVGPWLAALRPPMAIAGMLHQPPGGIDHGALRTRVQAGFDRWTYSRAARLFVASAALADDLMAQGVPSYKLVVVPPGRDLASKSTEPPRDLRAGRRAALVSVGNWVARKGLLDLLEAVSRLPDDAATLHLAGDTDVEPSYSARVRARLAAPDLVRRVVVHGPLPAHQVAALYEAADVFVLASVREPYGTVYGEAMAAGLPVVGYRAGNLPHLADDGKEGFVVPLGDIPALATALHRLVDDPHLRARMGEAAARRSATFPTWRDSAERLFAELRAAATSPATTAQENRQP
jgi:glycosyltransferase involved in cell wall biosynthesis